MGESTMKRSHKKGDELDAKPVVFGPSDSETRQFGGDGLALQKAQAAQFREIMKAKMDRVAATVYLAMDLFQNAVTAEKLAVKEGDAADTLIDVMVGLVISELTGGLAKAIANEMQVLRTVSKQALKAAAKGAIGSARRPTTERELADSIVAAAMGAARTFANEAKSLIDSMPDDQAAGDMQMLAALKSSPAVREESFRNSPQDGEVARGAENLFLEAAGAPATGDAQAEALAIQMLQTYKAERIHILQGVSERSHAVEDTLSGVSVRQIKEAEERTGVDQSVKADRAERKRASELVNPIVPPIGSDRESES